jgi:16S rRNA C1402 (ribose-2'-O) methylase RsmI
MFYALIGLSLALAGLAALQFLYLIYLERMGKEYKKRINELENHNKYLTYRLHDAEQEIADQNEILETLYEDAEEEEDAWADVIDER